MRSRLFTAVVVSAVVALAGAGSLFGSKIYASIFFTNQPLRVATVRANDDGEKFSTALRREIVSERARFQFSVVETPSVWASAQALREKKPTLQRSAAMIPPRRRDGRSSF